MAVRKRIASDPAQQEFAFEDAVPVTLTIFRGYRYELRLNNKQRTECLRHAGAARWAYNWGLRKKMDALRDKVRMPNAMDLHKQLVVLKQTEVSWMYEVSKCAPQEALRDLDKAFANFFAKRARFPKFKSRKRGVSGFRLHHHICFDGKRMRLPRLGWLRLKEESKVEGKILSATVKERAGRWFVSVRVQQTIPVPDNQGPAVGVDLGVNRLATLSDGRKFPNVRALGSNLKCLRRLSRRLARAEKGSKRRQRLKARIARLHYRISCIRSDTLHKLTSILVKEYGAVGIEDLNVAGMLRNHCLARVIADCGFGEFRRQMEYKATWYGTTLEIHDRFFPSSKKCSQCGNVKDELPLSERVYRCAACGLEMDRDLNAAINLWPGVPRSLDVDGIGSGLAEASSETGPVETSTEHCRGEI